MTDVILGDSREKFKGEDVILGDSREKLKRCFPEQSLSRVSSLLTSLPCRVCKTTGAG